MADGPATAIVADIGRSTTNVFRGHEEFDLYRIGWQRDFKRTLWQGRNVRLGGYWEASLNAWIASGDDVYGAALSPVFTLSFSEGRRWQPYLEAGIGLALLSDHRVAGRELSTSWQFEDRIGIGLRGEKYEFHYRYMHYSNAGADKPNEGVDAHLLGFSVRY
ncbi:MAG: acyloxyacyl hydrolase [Xanthomonadales bacterium]|nr:acyloxyacyl hydrolase [Xanthomonadales bacterium]NIX14183.1 acyloxyacyl hydrolase [Xanthomonadales bacterium]